MLHMKKFEYRGQQVNYYNKVRKDPKIDICWMATDLKEGLVVCWKYKENKGGKKE